MGSHELRDAVWLLKRLENSRNCKRQVRELERCLVYNILHLQRCMEQSWAVLTWRQAMCRAPVGHGARYGQLLTLTVPTAPRWPLDACSSGQTAFHSAASGAFSVASSMMSAASLPVDPATPDPAGAVSPAGTDRTRCEGVVEATCRRHAEITCC